MKRAVTAYNTPALAKSPLSRVCPKCGAGVGFKCGRQTEFRGWITREYVHTERQRKNRTTAK